MFLYRYNVDLDELIKRAHTPSFKNQEIRRFGPTNVPFNGITSSASMFTLTILCIVANSYAHYTIFIHYEQGYNIHIYKGNFI